MRKSRKRGVVAVSLALALGVVAAAITAAVAERVHARRPKASPPAKQELTLVTGYCNCGKCCGWKRNWFGLGWPVYSYGPMKGKRKQVGVTASGTRAKHGTVAADPKLFPFGTRLEIPGYGVGIVEDVGGAIKGRHVDVWFPTHEKARKWGTRRLNVRVVK